MEELKIKINKNNYQINLKGEQFSFFKEGEANIVLEIEEEEIPPKCFDLQFKEFKMPTLSFYVGENGNYNVSFNSTQPISSVNVTATGNNISIPIPDGVYTINSITFVSQTCTKTYTTPIQIDCPTLPFCNCTGENNGNFSIGNITYISGSNYSVTFNACNVNPLDWEIRDVGNIVVKTGSIVPTSGTVLLDFSGLTNGTYNFIASSSGCRGEANKVFEVTTSAPVFNKRMLVSNQEDFQIRGEVYNIQKTAGIDVISYLDLHWGKIERSEGNYNFGEINYLLNTLKADGLKLILWFKPTHCFSDAINSWTVYNENGSTSVISCASTSYLPSTSWERDRYGRAAGSEFNFNIKGKFTYSDNYASNRFLQYVARTINYINSHPNKDVIEGIGIIDGTYNETGFFSQSSNEKTGSPFNYPVNTDLGYADVDFTGFRAFVQNKYSNISNLNSAWGTSFVSFAQITKDSISKPTEYSNGNDIGYADNNTTKDFYRYKVKIHKEFYQKFINAVKNPSSVINELSSNTGIKTFAYITENFTSGQGRTWGVASLKSMYSDFDAFLSSNTAGSSPFHTISYLGDLYLRQCTFLATFPNKDTGFEQDWDVVEGNFGVTKTASHLLALGVKYQVVALQDSVEKWQRNVISDDGNNRTLENDVKRAKQIYFNNQEVTTPIGFGVIEYTEEEALINPHNPNNKKSQWISETNVNSGNLAPIKFLKCVNNEEAVAASDRVEMYGLMVEKNNGYYTDVSQMQIPNGYTAHYFVNEGYIGTTLNNYNLTALTKLPIMIRKLVLKNSTFPTYQSFYSNGDLANIPDLNQNIHSNSQLFDIV